MLHIMICTLLSAPASSWMTNVDHAGLVFLVDVNLVDFGIINKVAHHRVSKSLASTALED